MRRQQLKIADLCNSSFVPGAHYTFFRRVKLSHLAEELKGIFRHPLLNNVDISGDSGSCIDNINNNTSNNNNNENNNSNNNNTITDEDISKGKHVLLERTVQYLKNTFPDLPSNSPLKDVYLNRKCLHSFAKHIGIDTVLVDLHGLPTIKRIPVSQTLFKENEKIKYVEGVGLVLKQQTQKKNPSSKHNDDLDDCHHRRHYQTSMAAPSLQTEINQKGGEAEEIIYSDVILAMLAKLSIIDPAALSVFLQRHFFGGSVIRRITDVCRPSKPMLSLYRLLGHQPTYRLLHETGRYSSTSQYVVGVYDGGDGGGVTGNNDVNSTISNLRNTGRKLGEGNGPSILVAQERAATEALRAIMLRKDLSNHDTD